MKTIFLLLISTSVFGQTLSNTSQIIYKASATETINASFMPLVDGLPLSVKSTQQVYDDNIALSGLHVLDIALDSGETIVAKGAQIQYELRKNGAVVNFTPVTDNSLSNIKTLAQSAVGVAIGSLTTAQVRALVAVLLWKNGAINEDGTIKKLSLWAK